MMQQLINWLEERLFPGRKEPEPPVRVPSVRVRPPSNRPNARAAPPKPDLAIESGVSGRIVDGGPGKNILVRSKYVREDSGTHEVLKIVDESLLEPEAGDSGIDPYNTGRFDRSKNWNYRYRK